MPLRIDEPSGFPGTAGKRSVAERGRRRGVKRKGCWPGRQLYINSGGWPASVEFFVCAHYHRSTIARWEGEKATGRKYSFSTGGQDLYRAVR